MEVNIYIGFWTLKVKCTQYEICGYIKWPSRMQGQWFFQSQAGGQNFSVGSRKSGFLSGGPPLPKSTLPEKLVGGCLTTAEHGALPHPRCVVPALS